MDTTPNFNHDKAINELAMNPLQSKWEAHMAQFQDCSAAATANPKWQLMEQIYKMDK